jgi:hypothetical protein
LTTWYCLLHCDLLRLLVLVLVLVLVRLPGVRVTRR